MKFIIYIFAIVELVNQISTVQSQSYVSLEINRKKMKKKKDTDEDKLEAIRDLKDDPWWSYPVLERSQPDKEELKRNYEAWSLCVKSKQPGSECEALFEILVAPAELIIVKLQSYKLYIAEADNEDAECIKSEKSEVDCNLKKSNRERVIIEWKKELYPWLEIYEICTSAKSESFCEHYIKLLHLPENYGMKSEDQIKMMQLLMCVHSGGSTEKCIEDSKISNITNMKDLVQGVHVRDGDDL